jgi:hypothetical protein
VVWGALAALAVTLAVRLTLGHWAPFAAMLWLGLAATVAAAVAAAGRSRQSAAAVAQQA